MNITEKLIQKGTLRRSGQPIERVVFGVAHDTGNDNSTAMQNVDYYIKSANEMEASAHYFVDDKDILCCIPESEKAWHVRRIMTVDNELFGYDANSSSVSVELCYGTAWSKERNMKSYTNYVALWADICKRHKMNPDFHLVGHYKLDPARRSDPLNAFRHMGKTWDQFVADVKFTMAAAAPKPPVPPVPLDCSAEVKAERNSILKTIINFLNTLFK